METVLHRAQDRGHTNHGRLDAHHSFSFGNYYNPEMMGWGVLRVINDDIIGPGVGFGKHPHDNMEIITIPLSGALKHEDSMGGEGIIGAGDVQVMSAGSGVLHSEINASQTEPVSLFQIWMEPNKRGATPRYDQKTFDITSRQGKFQLLVSPDERNSSLMIHQNAFISRIDLKAGKSIDYDLYDHTNGVYMMVISGTAVIGGFGVVVSGHELYDRDAIGVVKTPSVTVEAKTDLQLLVLEVPM